MPNFKESGTAMSALGNTALMGTEKIPSYGNYRMAQLKLQVNTVEFRFFEPPRETKIGEFDKSGVKLQCSTEEGKQLLVPVIGRFEKKEGSRNRDSTS